MFHLDKAVFSCCILCGIVAVCYISVYVTISILVALVLFLFYESQVNCSRFHIRGLVYPNPLRKFITLFRLWTRSSLNTVMKACQDTRSILQKYGTSGVSSFTEENKSNTVETRENCASNHYSGLIRENFEYVNRRSPFGTYSMKPKSSDSLLSSNRLYSRDQRSLQQTPVRCSPGSEDLSFSPKGSPWGKSVSPKLRSHSAGVKTVQTVAGPLLASTRFNINLNSGIYGEMNSPGFSSRVARFASENSRSLTHQKQYSGPGQFPIVQLDRSVSKLPVVPSSKSRKIAHSPVIVRIAPPESSDTRLLNKSQILGSTSHQEQHSSKSVLEVLKEISRKRIYAQVTADAKQNTPLTYLTRTLDDKDDDDMIKRLRKGEGQTVSDLNADAHQVQREIVPVGKRAREESPSHCESVGQPLQQKNKRTRNNEILSSLSSSRNLLNNLKTNNKRKSSTADCSCSKSPILEKPSKQSRDSIGDTKSTAKTVTEVIQTTTSSTITPTVSSRQAVEEPSDKSLSVKPSEFLPKFAAVLDNSSGSVLNSVAALEAKRDYDSRTRLRSMLAVIAGEDDFIRKPPASTNVITSTATDTAASTFTINTTLPSVFPPVPTVSSTVDMPSLKEITSTPETIVTPGESSLSLAKLPTELIPTNTTTQGTTDITSFLPTSSALIIANSTPPTVPNTSAANTNSELLSSATCFFNKTTPNVSVTSSLTTAVGVPAGQAMPNLTLMPTNVAPVEQKVEPFKKLQDDALFPSLVATTPSFGNSYNIFTKSQPESSVLNSSPSVLPNMSVVDAAPRKITLALSNLHSSNGPINFTLPITQSIAESQSGGSSHNGGFSSSSANTIVEVPAFTATESTNKLFTLNTTASPSPNVPTFTATDTTNKLFTLNTTASPSPNVSTTATSNSIFGSVFPLPDNRKSMDLFNSSTSTSANIPSSTSVGLFSAAKNLDKQSTTVSSGTLNFGIKPATENNNLFPMNVPTSNNNTNPVGGFKFDISKGMKENTAITLGGSNQQTINFTTSTTTSTATITTTAATSAASTTIAPTVTSSLTILPSTTTSQSTSLFQFGSSVPKPLFSFNTNTTNGPTQSLGTSGNVFGNSQLQVVKASQKTQQSPFTFGTSSSSQNQNSAGTFSFGTSPALSNVKAGGFVFSGSGSLSSKPTGGMFGDGGNIADNATQPIFGSSGNKSDQVQSSNGMFGNNENQAPQPTNGLFGSSGNSLQQTGGLFGNSTIQSNGIFGNSSSTPVQVQSNSGPFGSSTNSPAQTLLPSGSFGVSSSSGNQPTGGLFGSGGSLTTQTTEGMFGNSGNLTSQSSQPGSGLFGGIGNTSSQAPQQPGGLFGAPSTQPTAGVFGGGGSTQPVFGFGSTSSTTSAQQPTASGSTGLFGSSTSLQTPFQFGVGSNTSSASVPHTSGGFNFGNAGVNPSVSTINFTAGTTGNTAFQFSAGAAPMFGGQTQGQGMFSIGSGSTAPRARATRMRRQR